MKTNAKNNPTQLVSVSWLLRTTPLAAAILALVLPSTTRGQADDFNDGNDAGWTRYEPLAGFGAPGTYSFPSGGYRIQAATSPNYGLLGAGRAGSIRNDASYSQFLVTYDVVGWNDSLNQAFGALARLSDIGLGATDGYAFGYTNLGGLLIARLTDEFPTILATAPVALNPANDYRFVFSGNGSSLNGQVFDLGNLSIPLATVAVLDATYGSGVNGLFVFDNSSAGTSTADATFDNYVATVPEPSIIGLLLLGGVGVLSSGFWYRNRRVGETF